MTELKSIKLLAGNGGHAVTRARIEEMFDTVISSPEDVAKMQADERAQIRAIASLFIPVDAALIDLLPNLEIISSFGVGYDHIDAQHAAKKNVVVTHTPSVLDDEVADTTVGLLLNTVRELYHAEQYLRENRWESEGNYPLSSLSMRNRTIGIFGLGRIGRTIAKRLSGFDVAIHYHSRNPVDGVDFTYYSSLEEMAEAVDTLISVVPGTAATHHAINANILKLLGSRGVLVNVGRGPVVDEEALIAALKDGTIAAAGLDVFEEEPKVPQALREMKNVSLLPHVASASQDTRNAMGALVIDNLEAWFKTGQAKTPTPETAHIKSSKA
ncbi:2-hydroxyacid dehydrogenase [Ahrensia marina]|uniref:Dehydrogenase n=1 Tax=Ahrensia marina TaxID=1514904 RepID=A0A0N0E6T8_9HYPH|nr:2-hydroxyacid dehydrogenase [Ahrensia marina]KPB00405.1 dehydrogenase [Ahrensia marina]